MAITPYLYYEDVDRALTFLAKAFGLRKYGAQMRGPDGKTNHAAMKLGSGLIMMMTQTSIFTTVDRTTGYMPSSRQSASK